MTGTYSPYELDGVVTALRRADQNILRAEAFTGQPIDSRWNETLLRLACSIGDAAFCIGINKIIIHRFVEQPWDSTYLPGNAMGQWGTHFDRTQTWWKPARAIVYYWQRCQGLLQWGRYVPGSLDDFGVHLGNEDMVIQDIHRRAAGTDFYFVANTSHYPGYADCTFHVSGMQPELWDPVSGTMRDQPISEDKEGKTRVALDLPMHKAFLVFFEKRPWSIPGNRAPPRAKPCCTSPVRGWSNSTSAQGPRSPWDSLTDWTASDNKGIRYYSGTAVYTTTFSPAVPTATFVWTFGKVNCIARCRSTAKRPGSPDHSLARSFSGRLSVAGKHIDRRGHQCLGQSLDRRRTGARRHAVAPPTNTSTTAENTQRNSPIGLSPAPAPSLQRKVLLHYLELL